MSSPTSSSEEPLAPPPVRRRLDPLLLVIAALGTGVGLIVHRDIRLGLYVCAGSLAAAALLRLVLRPRWAGHLVVRGRHVDVVLLAAAAAAIAVLAAITPFPRGTS